MPDHVSNPCIEQLSPTGHPNRGRLLAKYPFSAVAVKDLQSGKAIALDHKLDLRR